MNSGSSLPRLKVARIIGRLNIGGPARQACLLHQQLRRTCDTVLIVGTPDRGEEDMSYLLTDFQGVYRVGAMSRPVRFWSDVKALFEIAAILWRERPDVVHTHTAKAGALGRVAALLTGVKVRVHTYHGHVFSGYFGRGKTFVFSWIERLLNRTTTRVIAISESQRRELTSRFQVARPERVKVIHNGYDLSPFIDAPARGQLRRELGLHASDFAVMWPARMVAIKGVELFAEIAVVARRAPRIVFVAVGDGPERQRLESVARAGARIVMTGWRKDMGALWAAADCALLTSKNEGTPSALIEAMAAGKPFVSTPAGGVIDLLAPPSCESQRGVLRGANGFLASQPGSIVDCLLSLSRDAVMAKQLGAAGRDFAIQHFSHERFIAEIESLYWECTRQSMSAAEFAVAREATRGQ